MAIVMQMSRQESRSSDGNCHADEPAGITHGSKEQACHAGDVARTMGSVLALKGPMGKKKWQPTPVFLPGKSHGQRSLAGYSPWGRKRSDTTERLSTHAGTTLTLYHTTLRLVHQNPATPSPPLWSLP